ncbi:MAG: CRTAC1 family protein, partial [Blastocatellia bacterium]
DFAGEENRLFQNNGNGIFTDITAKTGLGGGKNKTSAVVPTDYNNQRDIDFFVVNYGSAAQLFSNQRDGSFKEIAASVGINFAGKALGVGAGDLNKDNFIDFYLPNVDGEDVLFLSDGKGGFAPSPRRQSVPSLSAQVADYDNDGLLDVVTRTADSVMLQRGLGDKLADAVPAISNLKFQNLKSFALGDFTNDGGVDLVSFNDAGSAVALKSGGFGKNFSRVLLAGKTSNRSAIGTKAELRSGSLRQKLEVYSSSPAVASAGVTFGLGYRTSVDALTMFWPAGIMQSELAIKPGENQVDELDRKGTSCPLLYAWNGSEFSFVTDFLGGCAIGAREPGNTWSQPD